MMNYDFNNGVTEVKRVTTPNGTKIVKLYFPKNCDSQALFEEIKEWAIGIDCDIGLLLSRNTNPYVVVSPRVEVLE